MGLDHSLTMKFVLVLLFVALAFAEPESEPTADASPEAWYGRYYGYPGYYRGYYGYGGYYGGYRGYGWYGRKKRDAEADPAVLASTSAVKAPQTYTIPYAYGYPYAHHVAPLTYTHAAPVTTYTHHAVAPAVY